MKASQRIKMGCSNQKGSSCLKYVLPYGKTHSAIVAAKGGKKKGKMCRTRQSA